jgi:replicative DNA helicase
MPRVARKPVANKREDDAPHDDFAERAVLGTILLDDARFSEVAAALDPADFFTEAHRRIYSRMRDLHARGDRVDRVLVAGELKRLGQLESVGGLNYLVSLDEQLPDDLKLDSYIRSVRKKTAGRNHRSWIVDDRARLPGRRPAGNSRGRRRGAS